MEPEIQFKNGYIYIKEGGRTKTEPLTTPEKKIMSCCEDVKKEYDQFLKYKITSYANSCATKLSTVLESKYKEVKQYKVSPEHCIYFSGIFKAFAGDLKSDPTIGKFYDSRKVYLSIYVQEFCLALEGTLDSPGAAHSR